MSRGVVFLLLITLMVFFAGCVQESTQKVSLQQVDILKGCQCHTQPWKYPTHQNGAKYCLDCHSISEHPTGNWSDGYSFPNLNDCKKCHETNLIRSHLPSTTCEDCHGDAKEIHKKFENRFMEESR